MRLWHTAKQVQVLEMVQWQLWQITVVLVVLEQLNASPENAYATLCKRMRRWHAILYDKAIVQDKFIWNH